MEEAPTVVQRRLGFRDALRRGGGLTPRATLVQTAQAASRKAKVSRPDAVCLFSATPPRWRGSDSGCRLWPHAYCTDSFSCRWWWDRPAAGGARCQTTAAGIPGHIGQTAQPHERPAIRLLERQAHCTRTSVPAAVSQPFFVCFRCDPGGKLKLLVYAVHQVTEAITARPGSRTDHQRAVLLDLVSKIPFFEEVGTEGSERPNPPPTHSVRTAARGVFLTEKAVQLTRRALSEMRRQSSLPRARNHAQWAGI